MSLAYFLSAEGHAVTVVEKEDRLGGNASWVRLGDFTVDILYHIITSQDVHLISLIEELGIADSLFSVKTRMGFYKNGVTYPVSTPREFLFFPPVSFPNRLRLGLSLLRSKMHTDWHDLEGVSARDWLSAEGGLTNYEMLWKPVMRSKFGPTTDEVVATDMWFRINRLSDLRSKKFKQGTYYLSGSLKTLFDAIERKLLERKVNILKGVTVERISTDAGGVRGVFLSSAGELSCSQVISTVPLPDLAKLLPGADQGYVRKLNSVRYLNNTCLILRLKERLSPYYQLNIGEEGFPFTGIIGADALCPPSQFGSGYVFYVSKYFTGDDGLSQCGPDALLEQYLPYLKKINPDFKKEWVLDIALTRKNNAEVLHTLHYSRAMPPIKGPIAGLYLLCTARIYPEATVLDASVKYAKRFQDHLKHETHE